MAIQARFIKTAAIERAIPVEEGSAKKEFAPHIEAYPCTPPQPLTDEAAEDRVGVFGKDYLVFGAVADIAEGDRFTLDEKAYRVVGVERWEGMSSNDHLELRVRIF